MKSLISCIPQPTVRFLSLINFLAVDKRDSLYASLRPLVSSVSWFSFFWAGTRMLIFLLSLVYWLQMKNYSRDDRNLEPDVFPFHFSRSPLALSLFHVINGERFTVYFLWKSNSSNNFLYLTAIHSSPFLLHNKHTRELRKGVWIWATVLRVEGKKQKDNGTVLILCLFVCSFLLSLFYKLMSLMLDLIKIILAVNGGS